MKETYLALPCPDCDGTAIVEHVIDHSPGCFYLDECMGKQWCPILWNIRCRWCMAGYQIIKIEKSSPNIMLKFQTQMIYAVVQPTLTEDQCTITFYEGEQKLGRPVTTMLQGAELELLIAEEIASLSDDD